MMRTLDQDRARHALEKVEGLKSKSERYRRDYVSSVENLPASIIMNGLGQALATLLAAAARGEESANDPHRALYRNLEEWLCRDDPQAPYPRQSDLMRAILSYDRFSYIQAQAEAMAWLEWHKKFAVAFLKSMQ